MGNTFEAVVVGGLKPEQVVHHLLQMEVRPPCFVGPSVENHVGILAEGGGAWALAPFLSARIPQPVLLIGVHDSDDLYYSIYQEGAQVAQFDSGSLEEDNEWPAPDFPPRFDLLALHFGNAIPDAQAIEQAVLHSSSPYPLGALSGLYSFENLLQHTQIPFYVENLQYEQLEAGDFPDDMDENLFIHVPGI